MGMKIQKAYSIGFFVCLFFFLWQRSGIESESYWNYFYFNFSLFSSDTDEEEMNRLAEAAVSGHSIIKNGKVILH